MRPAPSFQPARAALWLLAMLPLLCWGAWLLIRPGSILPADNLFQYAPYAAAAETLGVGAPGNPLYSDLILENYPWWRFIRNSLAAGELPLWNPYLFAGTPFLAKGQHMALYPLSLPFYVLPLEQAYSAFLLLHFLLAAYFTSVLARTIGLGRFSALVSGLTYGFSGFMLARAVFPMIVAAAAWLPCILAMTERCISRHPFRGQAAGRPWVFLGGLALGMQTLVGHPEILLYSILTVLLYTLCRCLFGPDRCRRPFREGQSSRIMSLLAMLAFGLMIGAVQLLPQFLVLQTNFRADAASFAQLREWGYPLKQCIALVVPHFFGHPATYSYPNLISGLQEHWIEPVSWGAKNFVEGSFSIGILPLVLAAFGCLQCLRPKAVCVDHRQRALVDIQRAFLGISTLALSFAFGTPLYALIYYLPGLDQIHSPFRWTMVSTLGLSLLAGYGISTMRARTRAAERTAVCLAGCGLALLWFLLLSRRHFDLISPFWDSLRHLGNSGGAQFVDAASLFSFQAPLFIRLGLLLGGSGLAVWACARDAAVPSRSRVRIHEGLIVLVFVIDCLLFVRNLYPSADAGLLQHTPTIIKAFKRLDAGRLTAYAPGGGKTFPANAGWLHDILDIRGYDSIFSIHYRKYMETLGVQDELNYNRIAPLRDPSALDSPLLDLLNVTHVLSEVRIDNPRFSLEGEGDGVYLYRNTEALGRAFLLPPAATIVSDDPFASMRSYDPRRFIILDAADPPVNTLTIDLSGTPLPSTPRDLPLASVANNEVTLAVAVEQTSWLVLADAYDGGWRASARPNDDRSKSIPLSVYRANGALRAVLLPAGDWIVHFTYRPPSLLLGLGCTLSSALLGLLGLAFYWFRRPNRSSL